MDKIDQERKKYRKIAQQSLKKYKNSKSNLKTDEQLFRVYTATIGDKLKSIPTTDDIVREMENMYQKQYIADSINITGNNVQSTILAESQRIEKEAKSKLLEEKNLRETYAKNQKAIKDEYDISPLSWMSDFQLHETVEKTGLNTKARDLQSAIKARLQQAQYEQKLQDEWKREDAQVKIAKLARGNQVRKQLQEERKREDAQTNIARIVRGNKVRKQVQEENDAKKSLNETMKRIKEIKEGFRLRDEAVKPLQSLQKAVDNRKKIKEAQKTEEYQLYQSYKKAIEDKPEENKPGKKTYKMVLGTKIASETSKKSNANKKVPKNLKAVNEQAQKLKDINKKLSNLKDIRNQLK